MERKKLKEGMWVRAIIDDYYFIGGDWYRVVLDSGMMKVRCKQGNLLFLAHRKDFDVDNAVDQVVVMVDGKNILTDHQQVEVLRLFSREIAIA